MNEIWKDIEGFEGLYKVSSLGRVASIKTDRILKPIVRPNGYLQIMLCKDGVKKTIKIHRIVAKAFPEICGEWFEGCEINHKDKCKTNNTATNLEVCDRKYNILYERYCQKYREESGDAEYPKGNKPTVCYNLDGEYVCEFKSIAETAKGLGVSQNMVRDVLNGKQRQTHGYLIKYKDINEKKPGVSVDASKPTTPHTFEVRRCPMLEKINQTLKVLIKRLIHNTK